ncbi:SET domain-containing protein-lysine N-methyltransferase [Microdochium nivale]|nr:SET domain-containing protein-lysine N-methyltransferase [Microdochium nivale]
MTQPDTMEFSDSDGEQDSRIDILLGERELLTEQLLESPYDTIVYLRRAVVHTNLAYPDLAAGDAYKALLLIDEVSDESFEYHEQAFEALSRYLDATLPDVLIHGALSAARTSNTSPDTLVPDDDVASLAQLAAIRCYQILSLSLLLCGCLKSACTFCDRGLVISPGNKELLETRQYIGTMAERRLRNWDLDVNNLPDWGVVRREVYPWNTHEPDRFSSESLDTLNQELLKIAPKCAVQVSQLPVLLDGVDHHDSYDVIPTCNQLGVFATEDIAPGEAVLQEYSLLTANNRLKDSVCDACSEELPPLGPDSAAVNCDECYDTVFCSQFCHDRAQEQYHPAVCDKDVDSIAKDPEAREADESLHLLLLARVLAIGAHQEVHPLDVSQIKYIWGDFVSSSSNEISLLVDAGAPPEWTLPFSFAKNIEAPLHILEKMDIDIYATVAEHDVWVFNTIYAKTRGTASARKSLRDMRPDVAAVHPFWCLANHDCDPNVSWEWGGRMVLWAREQRIVGNRPGGIKAGEEILNHYCDINLPVQQRREWASGSLGGWCMCQRCRTEALVATSTKDT